MNGKLCIVALITIVALCKLAANRCCLYKPSSYFASSLQLLINSIFENRIPNDGIVEVFSYHKKKSTSKFKEVDNSRQNCGNEFCFDNVNFIFKTSSLFISFNEINSHIFSNELFKVPPFEPPEILLFM